MKKLALLLAALLTACGDNYPVTPELYNAADELCRGRGGLKEMRLYALPSRHSWEVRAYCVDGTYVVQERDRK